MEFSSVNFLAVLVAAIVGVFGLGGLWYSPWLFGKIWSREAGINPNEKKAGHAALVFAVSFVMGLISAFAFTFYLGEMPDAKTGAFLGAFVGASFVATSFGINYMFAGRSFKLFVIDGVYHTLQFALYGIIFGLWH